MPQTICGTTTGGNFVRGWVLSRFHLFCVLLAHGKNRTQERATALWWGLLVFRLRRKTSQTHRDGEYEGTRFPHAPTGDTH
jgi:hypothetical protein